MLHMRTKRTPDKRETSGPFDVKKRGKESRLFVKLASEHYTWLYWKALPDRLSPVGYFKR